MKVRKAVIPAAGLGTRFLPITKAVPKELLPVVDRAAIHYVIEEAADAGIQQVVIVTARGKEAIADYFDRHLELEGMLAEKGDSKRLSHLRRLSTIVELSYVLQGEQLGLGHAVLCAAAAVGEEPFAILLPDVITVGERRATSQLLEVFNGYDASVISVAEVPNGTVQGHGIIEPGPITEGIYRVLGAVEKPAPEQAPSNLAILGRYIFTPGIFQALARVEPGVLGEIQLTDGVALLLQNEPVYAQHFQGTSYDVGDPMGLLKASADLALQREDMGPNLRAFMGDLLS